MPDNTPATPETVPVHVSDLLALERVLREIPGNLLTSEAESLNRLMAAIPMGAFEESRQAQGTNDD